MLDVGIEVEVRAHGVAQQLLIEAKERLDQLGIGGQRLELFPLLGRIAYARAEDQFQILPMEELGLFDIGCSQPECRQPLGEDVLGVSTDLRNGPQQRGKDQNSGVFAPVITRLGILRKKGRALRVAGGRRRRGNRRNPLSIRGFSGRHPARRRTISSGELFKARP